MTHEAEDVYATVGNSFAEVDLAASLDSVIDRGRRLRNRRRTVTGAAAMGVASVAALALALPSAGMAASSGHQLASNGSVVNVDLAGWSVHTNANKSVTLTMRDFTDPDRLRQVLAQAGIPAVVQSVQFNGNVIGCQRPATGAKALPAIGLAFTPPVHEADGSIAVTINPASIPAGAIVSFTIFTVDGRVAAGVGFGLYTRDPGPCVLPTDVPTSVSGALGH